MTTPLAALTVLLVDDEPDNLLALSRFLRHEPYRILTAESGKNALEVLSTEPVDILVTDLRMPMMSGAELLRRAVALCPKLVCLVLSANTEADAMEQGASLSMVYRFVTKPLFPPVFKQALQDAIQQSFALKKMGAEEAQ